MLKNRKLVRGTRRHQYVKAIDPDGYAFSIVYRVHNIVHARLSENKEVWRSFRSPSAAHKSASDLAKKVLEEQSVDSIRTWHEGENP